MTNDEIMKEIDFMKKKRNLILVAGLFIVAVALLAVFIINSPSNDKIDRNNVENVEVNSLKQNFTLNKEDVEEFITLFNNNATYNEKANGELVSSDADINVKYKNGESLRVACYGIDYPTIEIALYDSEGNTDERYYIKDDELKAFVYETLEKYQKISE